MESLNDRVAVVTGAASGIGRALAARLVQAGMAVVLADVEAGPLARLTAELEQQGAQVLGVRTDVTDAGSVDNLAQQARQRFGTVHLICNNAGVSGHLGRTWLTPLSDWRWVLDVNLFGVIHGIRSFVPMLLDQNEGHVVNTASGASWQSLPGMGPYGASKHAVLAVSQSLRHELEAAGSAVGVSVLTPPLVRTRILDSQRNFPDGVDVPEDATTAPLRELLTQGIDAGVAPEEVADSVVDGILANRFIVASHPEGPIAAAEQRLRIARGEWVPWPT